MTQSLNRPCPSLSFRPARSRLLSGANSNRTLVTADCTFKVLLLRMEAYLVEHLDDARERLGLKNRMQPFRDALQTYFVAQGETK